MGSGLCTAAARKRRYREPADPPGMSAFPEPTTRVARAPVRIAAAMALGLLAPACNAKQETPAPAASAAAPAGARTTPRARELLALEHRRDSAGITVDDLSSRAPLERSAAARALSRIADDRAAELLAKSLADEDPEVVAWAAYGLGYTCKGREPVTVRALIARAASLVSSAKPSTRIAARARIEPLDAIADALARCGTSDAERSLRAWLDGPDAQAEAAGFALGRFAARHKRLDDASIVALLDAASRPEKPLASAMFAFTRLGGLPDAVQARLAEVAEGMLARPGQGRALSVRALGHAGPRAVPRLAAILPDRKFTPSERADAARELARMGSQGQAALRAGLERLAPAPDKPLDAARLVSPEWGPLVTVLEALEHAPGGEKKLLSQLAGFPIPESISDAARRRVVHLRCRAAALIARTSADTVLRACDPDATGRIGQLAVVRVLDRGRITGPRHGRWLPLAQSADPVVRQAAIRLMPAHPEIAAPHQVLAEALGAKRDGTVASAAQLIAAYPDRASAGAEARRGKPREAQASGDEPAVPGAVKPHSSVVQALTKAFEVARPPDAIETRSALIDAAAALELLSLKPQIQLDCASDNPTLRSHAQKALRLFGERQRECKTFTAPSRAPAELASPQERTAKLTFVTDAGELVLVLDPELAPVAVTRMIELGRAGFFEGVVVHRVVPGFVAQFGDPGGDGYGGAGRLPLRCETAPLRFETGHVGVALAGRDTGSSQLFVTLGSFPHLDGDYPLIGRAEPGWDALAEGDVIRKVRVEP